MICFNCGAEYAVDTMRIRREARCRECGGSDLRPVTARERRTLRNFLIGLVLMLLAGLMLAVGIGVPAFWIAVMAVGLAFVVFDRIIGRRRVHA